MSPPCVPQQAWASWAGRSSQYATGLTVGAVGPRGLVTTRERSVMFDQVQLEVMTRLIVLTIIALVVLGTGRSWRVY